MSKPTLADQLGNTLPIISSTARAAFVASHFILALGSGFAIMCLVIGSVGQHLPPWLTYMVAWTGSFIWYKAVENPLRRFMLFAWAYQLIGKDEAKNLSENLQRTGRASIATVIVLLIATMSLSLIINVDIAEAVTTEQDSSAEREQANTATTSYQADVDLLREQLEEARTRDARRVKEAKASAAQWLTNAIDSKGTEMAKLYRSGNGWAKKPPQLGSRVTRATKRGTKHIEDATNGAEAPTLQQQLTSYVTTRSASRDTVMTLAAGMVTSRHNEYLNTKGRRNYLLLLAVFIVLVVFIFSARLLVLACLETGDDLDEDQGEGVLKVAGRMAGKLNAKLGEKLGESFGDKLVLAAVTTTPSAPTKRAAAPPTTPKHSPTKSPAPAKPVGKLSPKPSAPLSSKLSVKLSVGSGDALTVEIDGKEYTARKAADKTRRYYERWKSATKKNTADRNERRYKDCKRGMVSHFTFDEGAKSVSVKQK